MLAGMLLIDKPAGLTSHDVVQALRRKLGVRRIGHTGTLDPMAEGLLILLVGEATKHQQAFQAHAKVYEAALELGTQTDTGDRTGHPIRTADVPALDPAQVAGVLASLQGPLAQVPPAYSAVKVRGRPAYWWTRHRKPVTLAARTIRISAISLLGCEGTRIAFRIQCSAGTYVRSLAEVIAERLGTVGCLASLTRLRIGAWGLEQAKPLSWVLEASPEEVAARLQPVSISAV